ncbi:methyltransferase domain-containing protein [Microdochium trichocladiopsis]|uniref:Methyltransferase domain-containing protein n=1 Tax=Microdochium trichocladiopsis TaxID=1682393 RepID=A0A9P8YEQ7_9PEZI|nr:methyltransferase domain-containing protein [Microdochium trichocladiopsis]KAH7037879.1 methyltransferase domain-containing protein [Microdochium trichocladiopsis]
MAVPTDTGHTEEKVFRAYSSEQGRHYASARTAYPQVVYDTVVDFHTTTGGHFGTIMDVGCGPGPVVRKLATKFEHATGVDPSPGMIESATILGGLSGSSKPIDFVVSRAETLEGIADSSIDLVTVAAAAHWFDMTEFWPRLAQVVRPGGTVAVWSSSAKMPHSSNPNATALTKLLTNLTDNDLEPHMARGNKIGRSRYSELLLPWTIDHPVPEFDAASFQRLIWVPEGEAVQEGELAVPIETLTMDDLERIADTMSPITRWREAHPDLAGTERDLVKASRRKIEAVLSEGGAQSDNLVLRMTSPGVLLLFKRV